MSKIEESCLRGKLSIKHGFPFKSEYFVDKGDHIVLTPGNFHEEGGFKRTEGKEKYYSGPIPQEYIHSKGDLIVAMTEQAEGLLGSCAFVPENYIYLHNQRLGLITTDQSILDKNFTYYLFKTKNIRVQLRLTSTGTKVKHTSPERMYDLKAILPDVLEQQKIASVLSVLDAKIELNNRINAELEAMAKTLYDYWFVQFDFPDANGNPYKSSGGKMTYNPTLKREIPEGWEDGTLGSLFKLYQPKTISEKEFDEYGDYFVYGANGIVGKYNKYNHESQQVALTCRGSTCGNLTKTLPFSWITGNAMVMAPINHTWDIEFTYNLAKNSNIHAIITGSGQPQITRANLEGLKCIIAKDNIIENYCKVTSPISSKRVTIQKQNQELTQVRDWLLPMLMNGQVIIK